MSRVVILEPGDLGSAIQNAAAYPQPTYTKLELTLTFWGSSSFILTASAAAAAAAAIVEGALLWLPDERDRVFLIEHVAIVKSGRSKVSWEVTAAGRSIETWAAEQRLVIPDPGDGYDSQTSVSSETAMKHYVRSHAGVDAGAARQIPELVVAPDLGRGDPVTIAARYQKLGEVLLQLGLTSGLGWEVTLDATTGELVFDVVDPTDRSASVFLAFDFGTVDSWTDTTDALKSSTLAVVAGQGELESRDVDVEFLGSEPTGFARREAFIDARDVELGDIASLADRGQAFLAAAASTRSTEATVATGGSFQPDRDYFLGDVVLLRDDESGVNESDRVVKLVKTYELSAAVPKIEVSVGKPFPGADTTTTAPSTGATDTVVISPDAIDDAVATAIADLSAGGGNLVPNSSFESALAGNWTSGANWTAPYTGGGFAGANSARVQLTAQTAGDLVTPFIPVTRTDDYWFSVWSFLTAYTGGTARCAVREYDAAGTFLQSTFVDLTAAELDWTRHALHFGIDNTTPDRLAWHASTAKIRIAFLTPANATLTWQVDGIQLERGQILTAYAPSPQELVDGQIGSAQLAAAAVTLGKLAADSVDAAAIVAGAVGTAELDALSVSTAKIQVDAITASLIAAGAVGSSELAALAVTTAKIAIDAIDATLIAAGAVGSSELAAGAVIAGKITAGTIVAADIAANTITAGQIAALTITAAEIAANTITAAKIAAGTITATEIAALTITGAKIAANTITAAKIQAATITATEIAALTIVAGNIAAGTITGAKIAANTIAAANIVAGTITATELATDSVTSVKIAANAIVAGKIAAGVITATEIAANTITAAKIAAGTITATEIAAGAITTAKLNASAVIALVTNAGATVVIDATGIAITNGKLSIQDKYGTSSLDQYGFHGGWLKFLSNRVYGGDFAAAAVATIAATTISGTASTEADYAASLAAAIPYFVIQTLNAGQKLEVLSDATASASRAIKFSANGTASALSKIFVDIPVSPGLSYQAHFIWKRTAAALHDLNLNTYASFRDSAHAIIGSELSGGLNYTTNQAAYVLQRDVNVPALGAAPANAAYIRFAIEVQHGTTASSDATFAEIYAGAGSVYADTVVIDTSLTLGTRLLTDNGARIQTPTTGIDIGSAGGSIAQATTGRVDFSGHWRCVDGVVTLQIAGAVSDTPFVVATPLNGAIAHDTTNHRQYFKYGGVWHYSAQTAGFQVPSHERVCPARGCGRLLGVDDALIGKGDRVMADGALHALYVHLECAGLPLDRSIAAAYWDISDASVERDDPAGRSRRARAVVALRGHHRKAGNVPAFGATGPVGAAAE